MTSLLQQQSLSAPVTRMAWHGQRAIGKHRVPVKWHTNVGFGSMLSKKSAGFRLGWALTLLD